jgi:RHS repeat-associated protein
VSVNDPDLGQWQYSYDDAGRMVSQTDARGVAIDTSYDALGRPVERRHGATTLAAFTYDQVRANAANVGRLTGFTDPTGSTLRDYDPVGRLRAETKTIGADTFQVDWSFDVAGRVAAIRYPAVAGVREQVTQTYDASGRVIGVGEYVSGATYDARGNLTAATYGNGASVARSYSPTRGWMLGQTVTAGGVVRDHFAVTRDLAGDILTRTSSVTPRDTWQFTYNVLGHLNFANNTVDDTLDETFAYDSIGNRMSTTRGGVLTEYQVPAVGAAPAHAPIAINGVAVRYDANGNRLGIGLAPDAIYDATNRLVDDGVTTYAYDAEGTRVRAGAKVFVRDLLEVEGATSIRYYHLGRERVARRDHTGVVAYYHGDSIGTVRALTAASGAVAGTRLGFAFGELAETTGLADPFGIAGQRRDASGLYHMGARMMDPAHGQFTQPDPSGAPDPTRPQSLNRYAYASGNPIRISDPTGFQDKEEDAFRLEKKQEEKQEKKEKRALAPTLDDPLGIKIHRGTDEVVEWSRDGAPGEVFRSPRLYSKTYEAERERLGYQAPFAFESQTGRLFGPGAYTAIPFETMDDAVKHIEGLRELGANNPAFYLHRPQYLESADGALFRLNEDSTIDAIRASDVPSSVGLGLNLHIFLEVPTS